MLSIAIVYSGKRCQLVCDGRCDKAWGINGRPKLYFLTKGEPPRKLEDGEEPSDWDDYVYVRDSELGKAPGPGYTRGVSEGNDLKPSKRPLTDASQMNKWCARECERSEMFEEGEVVVVRDLEHPQPNVRKAANDSLP